MIDKTVFDTKIGRELHFILRDALRAKNNKNPIFTRPLDLARPEAEKITPAIRKLYSMQ